jgi:hypothetical protein
LPHGQKTFQIEFDLIDHQVIFRVIDGATGRVSLEPRPTAAFYRKVMAMDSLGIHVNIHRTPCELVDPIPFDQNEVHRSCDPEFVTALSVPKRPSGAEPGNRDNLRENPVPLDVRVADLQTYRLITIEYTSDRMYVRSRAAR